MNFAESKLQFWVCFVDNALQEKRYERERGGGGGGGGEKLCKKWMVGRHLLLLAFFGDLFFLCFLPSLAVRERSSVVFSGRGWLQGWQTLTTLTPFLDGSLFITTHMYV